MTRKWLTAMLIAAAVPAGAALAETAAIEANMAAIERVARAERETKVGRARYGSLGFGAFEHFLLSVRAGRRYRLVAVGDEDCRNLDLMVFDADGGKVLEGDLAPRAELRLAPTTSLELHVVVRMGTCVAEPCAYGVTLHRLPELGGAAGRT